MISAPPLTPRGRAVHKREVRMSTQSLTLPDLTEPAKPAHRPDDVNLADCGDLLVRNHDVDRENVPAESGRGRRRRNRQPRQPTRRGVLECRRVPPAGGTGPTAPEGKLIEPGARELGPPSCACRCPAHLPAWENSVDPGDLERGSPAQAKPSAVEPRRGLPRPGAGKKSLRLWPGAGVFAPCRENVVNLPPSADPGGNQSLGPQPGLPNSPRLRGGHRRTPVRQGRDHGVNG